MGAVSKHIKHYYKAIKFNRICNKIEGYLKVKKKYLFKNQEVIQYVVSSTYYHYKSC